MRPLVSIVMPSLNQGAFVDVAIDSVLGQDYAHIELIVADGVSTDGTLERLALRGRADQRLRWFSEANTGPAEALNKALGQARGTIIGWLNSDDLYTPGAISRAVAAFDEHPDWLMAYGHREHDDTNGHITNHYPTLPPQAPVKNFAGGCFICQPPVFFRRTMNILLGKLDESLKTAFEIDYGLRAFKAFPERIGFIDTLQASSRLSDESIALKQRRSELMEGIQVLARHLQQAPASWVEIYCEELITGKLELPEGSTLRDEAERFLEAVRSLLSLDDYAKLKRNFALDERLSPQEVISPADNAALAWQEFQEGKVKLHSTPRMLTLETTSRCNLRCVMCPHAIDAVDRPKHLEEHLLDKLQRFIKRSSGIQLHGIGEPVVSPGFWQVLPSLPPPDVCESSINTNLTILDQDRLTGLLDSNLKIINVSLDAATPETYRKIRGFDFAQVLGNLERLIAARNERSQFYPLVYLNMTLMRCNIEELQDFVRLGARLKVDLLLFWHLNRWSDEEMARYVIERDGWQFSYASEGLWSYPELSNRCTREAVDLASSLGVPVQLDHNKEVFFSHD